jgi:hypothetical protein
MPCSCSSTGSSSGAGGDSKDSSKLRRVRIQSLKEVHSVEEPTNPEVEFIIQVSNIHGKVLEFCPYFSISPFYVVTMWRQIGNKFTRHIS